MQPTIAQQLIEPAEFVVMDAVLAPVVHRARTFHPEWLAEIARLRNHGNDRCFLGLGCC